MRHVELPRRELRAPGTLPRLLDALGGGTSEIVVLPDVGHTMLLRRAGTDFDSLRVGTFAPAFLAIMEDWIRRWLAPWTVGGQVLQ